MKILCVLFSLMPSLLALDFTTLDGKTYRDCTVSKVFPDSICVLYSGSGARIKFTNLPEAVRMKYGYDAERAAAFEQAEAARLEREQALLNAQRLQSAAQRRVAVAAPGQPPTSPGTGYITSGSEYVGVRTAAAGGYGNGQSVNQGGNQFGNQLGYGFTGAQYVGVSMVGRGGIRGVTVPSQTSSGAPARFFQQQLR